MNPHIFEIYFWQNVRTYSQSKLILRFKYSRRKNGLGANQCSDKKVNRPTYEVNCKSNCCDITHNKYICALQQSFASTFFLYLGIRLWYAWLITSILKFDASIELISILYWFDNDCTQLPSWYTHVYLGAWQVTSACKEAFAPCSSSRDTASVSPLVDANIRAV